MNHAEMSGSGKDVSRGGQSGSEGNLDGLIVDEAKKDYLTVTKAIVEASPLGEEVMKMIHWCKIGFLIVKPMVSLPEAVLRKNVGCLHITGFRSLWGLSTAYGIFFLLPMFLSNMRLKEPSRLVPIGLGVCALFAVWTHFQSWLRERRGELGYPRSRGDSRFRFLLPKFISDSVLYYYLEPASLILLSVLFSSSDAYFSGFLFVSGAGLAILRKFDAIFLRIDWLNKICMRIESQYHSEVFKGTEGAKLKAFEDMGLQPIPKAVIKTAQKMASTDKKSTSDTLKSIMGDSDDESPPPAPVTVPAT